MGLNGYLKPLCPEPIKFCLYVYTCLVFYDNSNNGGCALFFKVKINKKIICIYFIHQSVPFQEQTDEPLRDICSKVIRKRHVYSSSISDD